MKKSARYLLFIFLLIICFTMPVYAENNSINIFVKGRHLYGVTPSVKNNRTLIPIESISEGLGLSVEYLEEFNRVRLSRGNDNIELSINSTKAMVNDEEVGLDTKPFIKDGSTFVPLRFISESFGEEVVWDEKNEIIMVGKFSGEAIVEDTFLYFNDEYGYTLSFPNSWKEEAIIETEDGTLYVYDRKSAERFMEDGVENFGPVLEIRCSDYPVIATVPYDDYLLNYKEEKYIEALFGRDFQFYPETVDSYNKIFNEAQQILGSFATIDDENGFVEYFSNN